MWLSVVDCGAIFQDHTFPAAGAIEVEEDVNKKLEEVDEKLEEVSSEAEETMNAAGEAAGAYNEKEVLDKCYNIYNTVERILRESQETGTPEGVIANQFAEDCIYGRA